MKLQDFDFRIWSVKKEKYLDELYSNIISLSSDKSIKGYNRNYKILAIEFSPYDSIPLMNDNEECFEIELFTGLYDKNGNKIYEGDILYYFKDCSEGEAFKYKVVFKEGAFYLVECGDNGEEYDEDLIGEFNLTELEIMGNIHENAELLNEFN
ncbi:TPA: YopX family protein [Campylobacter coli]